MQTTIHHLRIGYDVQGQGIPLLLMHAFPLNRSMFRPQSEGQSTVARVLTFDAPGVGDSEGGPVSMDSIADLGAALLDANRIDRAVVGGVSMGGYAAFAFVRRHAGRLLGLVLANTRPTADSEENRAARREMAALARQQGVVEIADRMLPKLLGETSQRHRPQVVATTRSVIESTDPEAIAALLEALAERADSSDLLERISVPTLVIAGEEDSLAPPDRTAEWARLIPAAQMVVIPQTGHLPNLEMPEAFNAHLEKFLRDRFPSS